MAFIERKGELGEIAAIRPSIMRDIDILLEFVERWNKKDEEPIAADAAQRVEIYLAEYRDAERLEAFNSNFKATV